ncbi:hypothetical protein HOLleu_01495 [Holothuria leucospilota]|uniref:Uncharacterized protein n=1 Tax=Holothuria leucospilota TaxID=206669 RepID=A0A9Q1CP37_HOLLE|nr:hypothetical protein HOLleu_01495 [Holothuria leucospilota]
MRTMSTPGPLSGVGVYMLPLVQKISCGSVIFVSPRWTPLVGKVDSDHESRLVCITIRHPSGKPFLCNVYAPNWSSDRRDFFMTLSSFVPGRAAVSPSDCEDVTCPISDHDAVTVSFQPPESWPTGRGFWNVNTDILSEADYSEQFKAKYEGWRTLKPAFSTDLEWWDDVKSRMK